MIDKKYSFANKVFTNLINNSGVNSAVLNGNDRRKVIGIVTSIVEFMKLLVEANDAYNISFDILERDQVILAEDFPSDQIIKLNNETVSTDVTEQTLRDIRIVTYTANELPATLSQRKIDETAIQQIKWKLEGIYDDPNYTGYSIIRYSKDIEAIVTFKVWGKFFQDIRQRAALLKDVIDKNTWFFKHKGLRDIIWLSSLEEDTWDNKNLTKYKTEKYLIRFSEIKELREKNLEQIVIQLGMNEDSQ